MNLEDAKQSIQRFVEGRIPPGDFIQSVLANDLHYALASADEESIIHIVAISKFVYNHVPSPIVGSWDKVKKHLSTEGPSNFILEP